MSCSSRKGKPSARQHASTPHNKTPVGRAAAGAGAGWGLLFQTAFGLIRVFVLGCAWEAVCEQAVHPKMTLNPGTFGLISSLAKIDSRFLLACDCTCHVPVLPALAASHLLGLLK